MRKRDLCSWFVMILLGLPVLTAEVAAEECPKDVAFYLRSFLTTGSVKSLGCYQKRRASLLSASSEPSSVSPLAPKPERKQAFLKQSSKAMQIASPPPKAEGGSAIQKAPIERASPKAATLMAETAPPKILPVDQEVPPKVLPPVAEAVLPKAVVADQPILPRQELPIVQEPTRSPIPQPVAVALKPTPEVKLSPPITPPSQPVAVLPAAQPPTAPIAQPLPQKPAILPPVVPPVTGSISVASSALFAPKATPPISQEVGPLKTLRPLEPQLLPEQPPGIILAARPFLPPQIDYPAEEKSAGHQGTATIQAWVSEYGTVTKTRVLKSSGYPNLDQAARKAVLEMEFMPARRGFDPPQPSVVEILVPFTLQAIQPRPEASPAPVTYTLRLRDVLLQKPDDLDLGASGTRDEWIKATVSGNVLKIVPELQVRSTEPNKQTWIDYPALSVQICPELNALPRDCQSTKGDMITLMEPNAIEGTIINYSYKENGYIINRTIQLDKKLISK